ncbi:MAG TPA: hypothetical protein VHD90_06060 [Phototrophicaceae bacterium]|nr:hypothetical protein [Phototrophicaceae bacterium]
MDEKTVKQSRQILRRVQDHISQAHTAFGVEHETVGFVDVIHHRDNALPSLNYVTPRRNMAWVSGNHIQQGLDRLQSLDRPARVYYIEGLFPPPFAKILLDLGLAAEHQIPLMIYTPTDLSEEPAPPLPRLRHPAGVQTKPVSEQVGNDLWWCVWRGSDFDVQTLGIEPLHVAADASGRRQEIDLIMYRQGTPLGIARVSLQAASQSAHIVALALQREARTPQLTRLLLLAATKAALARGVSMVFAPGENESDRVLCRQLGFIDIGTLVCYAARSGNVNVNANEVPEHDNPLQPVLALRR